MSACMFMGWEILGREHVHMYLWRERELDGMYLYEISVLKCSYLILRSVVKVTMFESKFSYRFFVFFYNYSVNATNHDHYTSFFFFFMRKRAIPLKFIRKALPVTEEKANKNIMIITFYNQLLLQLLCHIKCEASGQTPSINQGILASFEKFAY